MRLEFLTSEAKGISKLRGHSLGTFLHYPRQPRHQRVAYCHSCGASVEVDLKLKDATGRALTDLCEGSPARGLLVASSGGLARLW